MNDERIKHATGDHGTDEQVSTADLAGAGEAGHDSPTTEPAEPHPHFRDPNAPRSGPIHLPPSNVENPSSPRTNTAVDPDPARESVMTARRVNSPRPDAVAATPGQSAAPAPAMEQETGPLFTGSEANDLRRRWDAIQVGFVDEPRGAVEHADNLVAGTMKRLAEIFAEERRRLEHQWDQGENVSTEDLRLALRRYRSFFTRLLSV